MGNYAQPNSGNPAPNPNVTIQIENVRNPLVVVTPVPKYTQPGTANPSPIARDQLKGGAMGKSFITRADGSTVDT